MATLAFKVLFVAVAIAASQLLVSGHPPEELPTNNGVSDESDNECRGIINEGEPCQNGTGICSSVGGQGRRYGLMECVITEFCAPGHPGIFDYQSEWTVCWDSPAGTTITLTSPVILMESCPWDKIEIYENGTLATTLCAGDVYDFEYVSSSNQVCLSFLQFDSIGRFTAFCVTASW